MAEELPNAEITNNHPTKSCQPAHHRPLIMGIGLETAIIVNAGNVHGHHGGVDFATPGAPKNEQCNRLGLIVHSQSQDKVYKLATLLLRSEQLCTIGTEPLPVPAPCRPRCCLRMHIPHFHNLTLTLTISLTRGVTFIQEVGVPTFFSSLPFPFSPPSRGGATVLRVGGTNITASEASRKFFGVYPPHMPRWGVQQLQREAYGEAYIGQRCCNILLVVLVHL